VLRFTGAFDLFSILRNAQAMAESHLKHDKAMTSLRELARTASG
jgi:hypothetical protein